MATYAVTVSVRDTRNWIVNKRTMGIEASGAAMAAKTGVKKVQETLPARTRMEEVLIRVQRTHTQKEKSDG